MRSRSARERLPRILLFSVLAALAWGALAALFLTAWAFLVAPYRITVEPVEVEARGWPGGGGGEIRIAFFSDLELTGTPGRRERGVLRTVRRIGADVVAVGGDLFAGDGSDPGDERLRAVGDWLGEVARAVPHGAFLVWGEQEQKFSERVEAFLPPEVRSLQSSQVVLPAGEARVRLCGPEGCFAPMDVEKGVLRSPGGSTPTVASYRGPGAESWESLEFTGRLRFGRPGDAPGIAVLVEEETPGIWIRVDPDTASWRWHREGPDWKGSWGAESSLPSLRWLRFRVRVEVGADETRILSRAWPENATEPSGWDLRMARRDANRPRRGSIGVVAGGPKLGFGGHAWDDLEVRGPGGRLLLSEDFEDPERFRGAWRNPAGPPGGFDATVMIAHSPFQQAGIGRQPFLDLVLAGHTHGGQIRLPPFGPVPHEPELPVGWTAGKVLLKDERRWLYVSRGIGTSGLPVRLFCPPEVTDLTLRVVPRPPR